MFGQQFVHGNCTAQHTSTLVGDVQQIQQSLDRPVFAVRPVQDDQCAVDPAGIGHQPGDVGLGVVGQDVVPVLVQCVVDLLTAVEGDLSFRRDAS